MNLKPAQHSNIESKTLWIWPISQHCYLYSLGTALRATIFFWLFFHKSPHSCGRYGTRLGEDELFMVKAYTYFDEPPAPTGHVHDKSVCVLFLWGEGGWVRLHVAMVFILLFLVLNIHPCLLQFFHFFFSIRNTFCNFHPHPWFCDLHPSELQFHPSHNLPQPE